MKKIISLIVLLLFSFSILPVYGSDIGGGGSGGGSNGGAVSGSDWTTEKSGYRIAIVNDKKEVVSTVVDFVYSIPSVGGLYYYTNTRFEGVTTNVSSERYKLIDLNYLFSTKQIDKLPPMPLYSGTGGKLFAGGEQFNKWFLDGKFGLNPKQVVKPVSSPSKTPSSPNNVETGTTRPVSGSTGYKESGSSGGTGGNTI